MDDVNKKMQEENNQYKKDKASYEKVQALKSKLEAKEKALRVAMRKKEDAEIAKKRAQEDKDKTAESKADSKVKSAENEIQKIKSDIEKMKQTLDKSKEKVDSHIQEMKKDPEFEAHVNSILEKRYNRKLAKALAEKQQLDMVIALCKKHPTLENNLKGMVRAQEEIEKLEEELKGLDATKDQDKIKDINDKINSFNTRKQTNSDLFIEYCNKRSIMVSKEFLEKLTKENGFKHDKDGNILLGESLTKISKGYDKRIEACQKAIEKVQGAKVSENNTITLTLMGKGPKVPEPGKTELPAENFKWYEFRKRFNAWRQRKAVEKAEKEKAAKGDPEPEPKPDPKDAKASQKFRDAYKYDMTKDYVDAMEQAIYKQAAKEARKAKTKEEEKSADETQVLNTPDRASVHTPVTPDKDGQER